MIFQDLPVNPENPEILSQKPGQQDDNHYQENHARDDAPPNHAVNHILYFQIERTARATSGRAGELQTTITTRQWIHLVAARVGVALIYTPGSILDHPRMSEPQLQAPDARTPDPVAWVDEHGDYLFKYANFRLRDSSAAEDVVQETFLAAIKAYAKFEGRGSERTWLVGILKHKITDHFRKTIREAPIGEGSGDDGPEHAEFFTRTDGWDLHWNNNYAPTDWHATPEQLVEQGDFWKVFNDCLAPLPKRTASAFTFREVDGLSSEEICELLSISVNNLWVILHRARLHLRNCLEHNWFRRKADN